MVVHEFIETEIKRRINYGKNMSALLAFYDMYSHLDFEYCNGLIMLGVYRLGSDLKYSPLLDELRPLFMRRIITLLKKKEYDELSPPLIQRLLSLLKNRREEVEKVV